MPLWCVCVYYFFFFLNTHSTYTHTKKTHGKFLITNHRSSGLPLEPYIRLSYPIHALFYVESVKSSPVIVGSYDCWREH